MNWISKCVFLIRNTVKIKGHHYLDIGDSTRIRKCDISISGKNNRLIIHDGANLKGVLIEIAGNDCTLEIGSNCVIGEHCYFSSREKGTTLRIGNDCMFSRSVKLMTSDGHDILIDGKRINQAKDIVIGNHVWLADNVTVLKGVTVGDGSIVGINSTLTKSIGSGEVAAGMPAKVISTGVSWREELTY